MFKSNLPYAIWTIWPHLSLLDKLFFLLLCAIGIYFLIFAALATARLRAVQNATLREDAISVQRRLAALQERSTKLQQMISAAFYLFGFVLFFGLQSAYITIELSNTPVGWLVLRNFQIYFAFAANVFFVFLIIHFVQWFASGRVAAYSSRLDAQSAV
jgi:hypothetical protein